MFREADQQQLPPLAKDRPRLCLNDEEMGYKEKSKARKVVKNAPSAEQKAVKDNNNVSLNMMMCDRPGKGK